MSCKCKIAIVNSKLHCRSDYVTSLTNTPEYATTISNLQVRRRISKTLLKMFTKIFSNNNQLMLRTLTEKDNFPWIVTISDLHCFTLRGVSELPLLKPVSFNCTIGTSPKLNDQNLLTSLALCVHLDTTPVNIKVSVQQVSNNNLQFVLNTVSPTFGSLNFFINNIL